MEKITNNIGESSDAKVDFPPPFEAPKNDVAKKEKNSWPDPFEAKKFNPDGTRRLVIKSKSSSTAKKATAEYANARIRLVVKPGGHSSIIDRSRAFRPLGSDDS